MARRSRKSVTYEQIVKGFAESDSVAWVKELLKQNNSKYSRVNLSDEEYAVELCQMEFDETLDEDDDWKRYSVWFDGYHYKVAVDIWCGCPLQVHTVYVYGDIHAGSIAPIRRRMILDDQKNRLVKRGTDCVNHHTVTVWHGAENFGFWNVPPYVEESGVTNEDLLDMNEPCWSW